MALRQLIALLLLLAGFWSGSGLAHESQPGLLEIRQLTEEQWEVVWRAPIYYGKPHPARLALAEDWRPVGEPTVQRLESSDLHRQIVTVPPGTLDGSVIGFPGLEQTITDVFVRLSRLDGSEASQVVRPTQPTTVLRGERPWHVTAGEYLVLGLHHILLGIDHLLFVLGLLIIVRGPRMLVETITAFTVAHSITLGLATLGYASVPGPPLNAAIALSILFLGPEMVRAWRGQTSFTLRHPWLLGGLVGLRLPPLPDLTWLGTASFLVLGLLVAADAKLPPIAVAALAGAYGTFHGLLNGAALAATGAGPSTLLGIVLTALALALFTAAAVVPLRIFWARVAFRVAGSWVAAVAMLMLGWMMQGMA